MGIKVKFSVFSSLLVRSRSSHLWMCVKYLCKLRSGSWRNTHIFFGRMCSELSGEDVQDLLADPAALGERREREVVRVDLAETCNDII